MGILAAVEVVLIAVLASVAGAAGTAATLWARPRRRLTVGESVIVATRRPDDQSIQGIVDTANRRGVALAAAHYLEADGTSTALGAVWVPIEAISFVQTGVVPIAARTRADDGPASIPLPEIRRPARLRSAEA